MEKFSKQMLLLTLGLIMSTSLVSVASAVTNPDCPAVITSGPGANAPLKANEAYGFYATGADSAAGANATTTLVGDMETDSTGCPEEGFFSIDDNGFPCTGTLTSVLTVNSSPAKTGTMTWTSACFTVPIEFAWANGAGVNPTVMYFSSNSTTNALVMAGKLEDNGGSDGPTLTGTSASSATASVTKHHHHHN